VLRVILPFILSVLAALSLVILKSIAPGNVTRQFLFFVIGGMVFWFTSQRSFPWWMKLSPFLYAGLVGGLVLTQLIGQVTRGTHSWIPLGAFHLQPSQLAVPVIALGVAAALQYAHTKQRLPWVVGSMLIMLPPILIFLEPDFGTAAVLSASILCTALLLRIPIRVLAIGAIGLACCAAVGWSLLLRPDQRQRVETFLNPLEDRQGAGYNAWQSVIAVGSGMWLGKGIGQGTQSHLRFLPERQTDFVFASLAEEIGFLGSVLLVVLYAALWLMLLHSSVSAHSDAERAFYLITAWWLLIQVTINIGMNVGLLPITGITLPLLSYGGSSLLSVCWHFGLVMSAWRNTTVRATGQFR
jgi:rod shape determining protein RodA